jgi:hypothetical protein
VSLTTLFKTDVQLNKHYPGLTQYDILNMFFYEYLMKLDIIKEIEEEKDGGQTNTDKEIQKHRKMSNDMVNKYKTPNVKLPKMSKF